VGAQMVFCRAPGEYPAALASLVKDGIMEALSVSGGWAHPGDPSQVRSLVELRKLAVEIPDLQVCPVALGFWVPWKALNGAQTSADLY
jgi:hypothetical protein